MVSAIDRLMQDGCSTDDKTKVCRSRGGESCAFDGAMIVLQPIADTAHIVHGPIACCGNTWEGRGTQSSRGVLHTMGFTTDMGEIDIVYGSEDKLLDAIRRTFEAVRPKAIFVYSTCVSGMTGEDIDAVCKRAGDELDIRVIPVNAPGFVGPKNLGNRIAGEVLLDHVIGTGETPVLTHTDINLIGEYNIAGDLWLVEPLLARAGIRILSKITGESTFEEITWAHQAKLNVVVCSRALINVAREMERRYDIPFVEVSFFGSTEIAKALRKIAFTLQRKVGRDEPSLTSAVEDLIKKLDESDIMIDMPDRYAWTFRRRMERFGVNRFEAEHKAYGIPFPPTGERFEPRGLVGAGRALYTRSEADVEVRLRLGPEARWVAEYYETEEELERADGRLEVVLPAGRLEWAERLVLRLSGAAEVLGPPELKVRVAELARRTRELYG